MNININKALEHFKWKFNNGWKPTQTDITAYNSIAEFVEQKHSNQISDNQLFAKLYIKYYGELLQFYTASVFDKEPQKELHKILDTPIEDLIKEFTDKANFLECILKMKKAGINVEKHPRTLTDLQILKEKQSFKMEFLDNEMTEDEATDNLKMLINLALKEFN